MENLIWFFMNISILLIICVSIAVIPIINRKSLLFGVRIPNEVWDLPEVKALKKNYITIVFIGTLILILITYLQYLFFPNLSIIVMLYFPFLAILIQPIAYIPQWKKAKELKEKNNWIVPEIVSIDTFSSKERENLKGFPVMWYIASIILIIITVAISFAYYSSIPNTFATHFNINMEPDAWANKSFSTVFIMPIITFITAIILLFSNIFFFCSKLQINNNNPALSFAQHNLYRKYMSHSLGFCSISIVILFCYIQFTIIHLLPTDYMFIFAIFITVVSIGPICAVAFICGQSGCKLLPEIETNVDSNLVTKKYNPSRGDDKYWKFGMFYYNHNDPAIILEDRFGLNIGFNYANIISKIIVFIILAIIIITLIFTTSALI